MSNGETPVNAAPAADGPGKLDAALQEYLNSMDVSADPDMDRPLIAVMAQANQPKPADGASSAPSEGKNQQHPPALAEEAAKWFTADEIAGMTTADLRKALVEVKSYDAASARAVVLDRDGGRPVQQNPPAGASPPSAPVSDGESPRPQAGALTIDWGQDADVIDPEVRTVIEGALAPLFGQLQSAVESLRGQVQPILAKQHESVIDRAIAGLGLDSVLGKGSLSEVAPEEQRRRVKLVKLAMAEGGDFFQSLRTVAHDLYGGIVQPPAATAEPAAPKRPVPPKDPETGRFMKPESAEEWEQGTIQRPTSRLNSPEPKGERKAVRSIHELIVQHGRSGGVYEINGAFNPDTLPD